MITCSGFDRLWNNLTCLLEKDDEKREKKEMETQWGAVAWGDKDGNVMNVMISLIPFSTLTGAGWK
jgi:hypothetical protein